MCVCGRGRNIDNHVAPFRSCRFQRGSGSEETSLPFLSELVNLLGWDLLGALMNLKGGSKTGADTGVLSTQAVFGMEHEE